MTCLLAEQGKVEMNARVSNFSLKGLCRFAISRLDAAQFQEKPVDTLKIVGLKLRSFKHFLRCKITSSKDPEAVVKLSSLASILPYILLKNESLIVILH